MKNEFSLNDINANIKNIYNKKTNNNINYNFINRPKDPVTQKMIKKLKTNEKEIMNELTKIMNNEKLLKNQSYLKLINTNPNNINVDKRKLEAEIKALNENKNYYMIRLDEIKTRIKSLEYKYELEQGIYENDRQEKLQKFFEKQNRIINQNNDESNLKIRKMQIENKKLLTNMHNDAENKLKKKIEEFEKNKEKEAQNKIVLMNKMREDERKEILKRKNKANEETKKLNEYMNKKPDIKKYLYQKIKNSFNDKLNKRLLKENNKRKLFMKPMENDIHNMLKNYEEYKKKKSLELEEKTQKLKKSWSERNLLIPTYKTQLRHMIDIEQQNLRYEKEHEKEKKKEMKNIQMKYSKKIENQHNFNMKNINSEEYIIRAKNIPKPHYFVNNINNYCDIIREKIFLRNNNKSQDNINPLLSNNNDKDKDIQNKNNKDLNISEKNDKANNIKLPSLDQNKIKNLKKYTIGKNIILNQNKNIKTVSNAKIGRNIPNINKTKKNQTLEVENINYKGTKEIQKLIEKNGLNKSTFEMANCKLESLNERQKQKSLLLKHEGGFIKNPGLGEEVCDILIDSMTAKLSLINEIDKIQNNKNKPVLVDVGTGPGGEGIKNINGSNKNKYNQKLSEEDEQNDYSSINKEGEGVDEGVDE